MSQLGTPINGALNLNPLGAGNPFAGVLSGPAGLAAQYGQSYNNALAANQQNYSNILSGYQTVINNVGQTLGQGGTPWGVAAPAAQAIADTYQNAAGGAFQNSINKGIGNTTAASAAQRGAALDAQKAYAGLGAQLAQTYAGYEANLGQGQLNFMNSVQIPYPNGADYSTLYQQYGAQQANAVNNALLQQAQRQSFYAANGGRGGPSTGGASTPQMPRGGTFGTGGGGFPSGGAAELASGLFGRGNTNASGTGPAPITGIGSGVTQSGLVGMMNPGDFYYGPGSSLPPAPTQNTEGLDPWGGGVDMGSVDAGIGAGF